MKCSVPGCNRMHYAHGLCKAHYQRLRKHGDVRADVPIDPPRAFGAQRPGILLQQRRTLTTHPTPTPQATPCRLWQGATDRSGYGVRRDGQPMHRWVMEVALGRKLEDGEVVMHLCDQPLCYRFEHLRLATQTDNNIDRSEKGRGSTRLNAEAVRAIRSSDENHSVLARRYGVAHSTIRRVRSGESWQHITDVETP